MARAQGRRTAQGSAESAPSGGCPGVARAVCEAPLGGRSAEPTQGGMGGPGGAVARVALGNNRKDVSTFGQVPGSAEQKIAPPKGSGRLRAEMHGLREALWKYQPFAEQQKCGRVRYAPEVGIVLAHHEHCAGLRAYFTGVKKCKSARACPVCSMAIAMRRGELVASVVERWTHAGSTVYGQPWGGGGVALVTLTLRHDRESDLKNLVGGLRKAVRRMRQGRWWQDWKERWGYAGEVQAIEATHGWANSWHPHLHSLMFFERLLTEDERRALECELFERWHACVVKELGERHAPNADYAVDVSIGDQAGWYLTKLGLEVSSPATKKGSDGNRSIWQIAADIAEHERPEDVALWKEFCRAFRGKAQVTWSKGRHDIQKRLGLKDADDEDDENDDQEDDVNEKLLIADVPGKFWDAFARARVNAGFRLLQAAEQGGTAAVDDVIRRLLVEVAKWERERERKYGRGPAKRAA